MKNSNDISITGKVDFSSFLTFIEETRVLKSSDKVSFMYQRDNNIPIFLILHMSHALKIMTIAWVLVMDGSPRKVALSTQLMKGKSGAMIP